ncbi:hypothetical protein NliqN6_2697 [Naganishia liquefaciens]|uniref:SGNH hydrolase-type esterase domain-containing protein n=1 Tax=Naganishia liquefaciens TaxID=104408 RepID=A0A8H3TTC1_9TREE|nr:hypothetical protein NliqN6_2697 [Naganishia liquefaciens]
MKFISLFSLCAIAAAIGDATAKNDKKKKGELSEASFVLIGDSTTNNNTVTPNSGGWGNGFCASLQPGIGCANFGSNGATTGTIVTRGLYGQALDAARSEVDSGKSVFVTIQFGHNDMKIAGPESMAANMTQFVSNIRGLGAHPIILTPLSRRGFKSDNITINDTLGPWADAARGVATQTNTTLLPLLEASINYLQKIGPDAAHLMNRLPADNTHLNLGGQELFGRVVADLMALFTGFEVNFGTESPFVPNPPLSEAIWTGKQYVFEAVCPSYNASECIGIQPRPF